MTLLPQVLAGPSLVSTKLYDLFKKVLIYTAGCQAAGFNNRPERQRGEVGKSLGLVRRLMHKTPMTVLSCPIWILENLSDKQAQVIHEQSTGFCLQVVSMWWVKSGCPQGSWPINRSRMEVFGKKKDNPPPDFKCAIYFKLQLLMEQLDVLT